MRIRPPVHKYWNDGDDPAERLIKKLAYYKQKRSSQGGEHGRKAWEP